MPLAIGRDGGPREPRVEVQTWPGWVSAELGWMWDADGEPSAVDWLLMPHTRLLGITDGPVFADPSGALARTRKLLDRYPDPVWWWVLASQWRRLEQEEPFVQRTAEVEDEVGSRVVAARLVRDAMRLAILMARRYPPYSKWLGSAFSRLPDPDGLGSALSEAPAADDPGGRERALGAAYTRLARRFNDLSPDRVAGLRGFYLGLAGAR